MSIIIREVINVPRGDGTGPAGAGKGFGLGRQTDAGAGRGRMGGPKSAGPEGYCECPKCGTRMKHNIAEPCNKMKCPQCGSMMVRS